LPSRILINSDKGELWTSGKSKKLHLRWLLH
jgi:hypothetical protein